MQQAFQINLLDAIGTPPAGQARLHGNHAALSRSSSAGAQNGAQAEALVHAPRFRQMLDRIANAKDRPGLLGPGQLADGEAIEALRMALAQLLAAKTPAKIAANKPAGIQHGPAKLDQAASEDEQTLAGILAQLDSLLAALREQIDSGKIFNPHAPAAQPASESTTAKLPAGRLRGLSNQLQAQLRQLDRILQGMPREGRDSLLQQLQISTHRLEKLPGNAPLKPTAGAPGSQTEPHIGAISKPAATDGLDKTLAAILAGKIPAEATATPGTPALPQLYIVRKPAHPGALPSLQRLAIGQQGNHTPQLNTVRELIARIERLAEKMQSRLQPPGPQAAPGTTGENTNAIIATPAPNDFLATGDPLRLDPTGGRLAAQAAAADHAAALADTVRQVQGMLADMAERLNGELRLDPAAQRATIQLYPPQLGRLHVQVQIDDNGQLHAHFQSDNSDTGDFLQQQQQDLREELAEQGFSREDIHLSFDEDQARAFAQLFNTALPIA